MPVDAMNAGKTIADILGPWVDSDWGSGLIERCKGAWNKPLDELTDQELATLLRQDIATEHILPLAENRILMGFDDSTEICDGDLERAIGLRRHGGVLRGEPQHANPSEMTLGTGDQV